MSEGLDNTLLQDSVVGGNLHSGNVTNHYHIVNEVKSVPTKVKRQRPKRKQTLPTKVKRQRPKRKGTWARMLALGLRDFMAFLFLMTFSLLGIFVLMFVFGSAL